MHTEGYGLRDERFIQLFVREFAVNFADFGVAGYHAHEKCGNRCDASASPKSVC